MRVAFLARCGLGFGLALCLAQLPAFASGGVDCHADDGTARLDVAMTVSHGVGSQISNATGSLQLKDKAFPAGIAPIELSGEALVHHWLAGKALNLHYWKDGGEKEKFTELELIITTKIVKGDDYATKGTYEVILRYLRKPDDAEATVVTRTGKITCGGE